MMFLKGFSLFFLYPFAMFVLGFWGGVRTEHFFYPGSGMTQDPQTAVSATDEPEWPSDAAITDAEPETAGQKEQMAAEITGTHVTADTAYVLLERDVDTEIETQTETHIPYSYIGMDRLQFVTAVESYSKYPPLEEQERGFVNEEIVSFSGERVVVRKNYRKTEPQGGFYLAVSDHELVVYREDLQTIYLYTGIMAETLPEQVLLQVMQTLYLEDEEQLYSFLETYSS